MDLKKTYFLIILLMGSVVTEAQEVGLNFNHNPEIIDFHYVEKTGVEWLRTTPRILDYTDGILQIENDPGLQKFVEAGERGYKLAFGFRWDFKQRNLRLPEPGSENEKRYFQDAKKILEKVGPYLNIFKLGNEPNLETLPEDLVSNEDGVVPLVRFTRRLLEEVVEPYYQSRPDLERPDIYVGSFPRLFMPVEQESDGVRGMISFANENPAIKGLAVHLHVSDSLEIDESFRFVRSLMPDKPIIVPEFSFHRLYIQKLDEPLVADSKGERFVKKYNRNPEWKLYDWFGYANTHGVSREEWKDLFDTLEWFPHHNLLTYYDRYQKNGVVLATYPLFQQSAPKDMTANSPAWFINPIFCQKSLLKQPNGEYSTNPLHFEDFIRIVEEGKAGK